MTKKYLIFLRHALLFTSLFLLLLPTIQSNTDVDTEDITTNTLNTVGESDSTTNDNDHHHEPKCDPTTDDETCRNPDTTDDTSKIRIVSEEELATKIGTNDGDEIWLSVLGQVFDVTNGGRVYYGPNAGGYNVFAGKDASPLFWSGEFNEEGMKVDILDLDDKALGSVEGWAQFYQKHKSYIFIGYLEGKYYDSDGKPTEILNEVMKRVNRGRYPEAASASE